MKKTKSGTFLFLAMLSVLLTARGEDTNDLLRVERQAINFYVENCRADIVDRLKADSYYRDKDVEGFVSSFTDKELEDAFLKYYVGKLAPGVQELDAIQLRDKGRLENFLKSEDVAKKCRDIGAMHYVYESMGRAREYLEEAKKKEAVNAFIAQHAKDEITIDYSLAKNTVGGVSRHSRAPKGDVRKLTLGQYLQWESQARGKWQGELWNALGLENKNEVYAQCLQTIAQEWTESFGYRESVLRAPVLKDGFVDLNKATRNICSPG